MVTENVKNKNPLGNEKITDLLFRFAIPSIIAMLVSSLYNIVDQFFIGRRIGELGNAATNISFPLSVSCVAIALLFGIGGASAFNLSMGKGKKEEAVYYMGNAAVMMFVCGCILMVMTEIFLRPLLGFFGSPADVLGYAVEYTRIIAIGFPFLIFATGGGHLIRADGSPGYTMKCNLTGAVINIILDALLVFKFDLGMTGAAVATIIGQSVSFIMAVLYLRNCKTVQLKKRHLKLHKSYVAEVVSLGAAPCSNQLAIMVVQIVMNNTLKHYGRLSDYGESTPIACVGIITKVNQVYMSIVIGISQGLQPIVSFNYGAGKYKRVKEAYIKAISSGLVISVIAFLAFQFLPRQIIKVFGDGSDMYFKFAINYFRIFLFFTYLNCMQPITSNFMTAIGKPKRGIFLSLTRQIIFLLPLIVILPVFWGIDGVMYAGPIADGMAGITAIVMVYFELKRKEYGKVKGHEC